MALACIPLRTLVLGVEPHGEDLLLVNATASLDPTRASSFVAQFRSVVAACQRNALGLHTLNLLTLVYKTWALAARSWVARRAPCMPAHLIVKIRRRQ